MQPSGMTLPPCCPTKEWQILWDPCTGLHTRQDMAKHKASVSCQGTGTNDITDATSKDSLGCCCCTRGEGEGNCCLMIALPCPAHCSLGVWEHVRKVAGRMTGATLCISQLMRRSKEALLLFYMVWPQGATCSHFNGQAITIFWVAFWLWL